VNGASPDPTKSAREPDAVARLQLTQALQRAQYAIAWERAWPGFARVLSVVGLFLVASWAGLWLALPFLARAIGIGLFVGYLVDRAAGTSPLFTFLGLAVGIVGAAMGSYRVIRPFVSGASDRASTKPPEQKQKD